MKKCRKCKNEAIHNSGLCEICTLKAISIDHFGTMSYWKDLYDKYIDQGGLCAYSGIRIHLGKNASLDHIVPKSRGGQNNLSNVHWVDTRVNIIKRNSLDEEFLPEFDRFITSVYVSRKLMS